jgi:hypothetical protein
VYPQLLGKTVLINPPSFFKVLYSAFSVFMPQSALDKVAICPATDTFDPSADKVNTCPFVKRWCGNQDPLKQVPSFLGGTAECPASLKPLDESGNKDLTTITVENRECKTVDLDVSGPSTVQWLVMVSEYGVVASATFEPKDKASTSTTVLEPLKIEDKPALVKGELVVKEAGVVKMKFDNSDSWIRSTTFAYKLAVLVRDEAAETGAKKEANYLAEMLGKLSM